MEQLEKDALRRDKIYAQSQADLSDKVQQLRQIEPSIVKAAAWRQALLEAVRESARLPGPIAVGNRGILGLITPGRIIDDETFAAEYETHEILEWLDAKAGDGIVKTRNRIAIVELIVEGESTKEMHAGEPVLLDETFEIVSEEAGGGKTVYRAKRTEKSDTDRLFSAIEHLTADAGKSGPTTRMYLGD